MIKMEQWQKATQDLYKKQNLSNKHQNFSQYEISPLAVEDEVWGQNDFRTTGHIFHNVIPYHNPLVDEEFLRAPGTGIGLKDEWPDELESKDTFVYLAASPLMTSFKKALLNEQSCSQINFGVDPYGLGLWQSKLFKSSLKPETLEKATELGMPLFRFSGQPYGMAGVSESQQLAILLASAVQVITDYEGPLTPAQALSMVSFEVALQPHILLGVSTLRCLRILLARLMEIYEVEASSPPIYAVPSARFLGAREPWNNILRMTAVCAAAKMGGADGFVAYPYDLFSKKGHGGRRASRNIAQVLELESFLGQVNDPWLGSYSLSSLESQMLEKSWQFFAEIEHKEGLRSVLRSGWLLSQIEVEAEKQEELFAKGAITLTGVNDYPLAESLSEEYPLPKSEDCLSAEDWWVNEIVDSDYESLCDVARFVPKTLASKFEKWQFRGDQLKSENRSNGTIPVLIEKGQKGTQKHRDLKYLTSLAGLAIQEVENLSEVSTDLVAVVASDPEGDFVKDLQDQLEAKKIPVKIWVGIKKVEGFTMNLNRETDFDKTFEKIFQTLEDQ